MIIPLFDRVLLRPQTEQVSEGGIYVPRESAERTLVMTVVAVGDGVMDTGENISMCLHEGERVLVAKYAGSEIALDNEKLCIVKQCDVLAKL